MIRKEEVISILQSLLNTDNESKVKIYIRIIREMTEEQWQKFLESKSIESVEQIEKIANELLERRDNNEKIKLNDLISYGISGNTIHIHVVPTDLHHMLSLRGMKEGKQYLIDALEQIKALMKQEEYKNIDKVFAVSPIIRRPITQIFEDLGFSTRTINMKDAENDDELQYFYERFKGKGKKLGRAVLSKQQLFSEEWEQLKNSQKISKGDDSQEL